MAQVSRQESGGGENYSPLHTINHPWWSKPRAFVKMRSNTTPRKPPAGSYMPHKIGDILNERYRIEEILGQGGMGAVYRAIDINLGVEVAVKENLFITEEYARQFRREATILASLRHPNLPRVTDHFVIGGEGQFLIMDFVDGEDLRERLERNEILDEEEALPLFLEICDALAYLHSRTPPIIHRDIKPGNVKVTQDGRAVLVDFGLAKVADDSVSTTTGAKAMTPGFSPPEQYGTGPTDARTDVYSLAATLYAALSGCIPEDALERAMGREKLTPLQRWNSKVSPAVARAVQKALSIPPDRRYQSVTEFAAALGATITPEGTTVSRGLPYLEPTLQKEQVSNTATLRTRVDLAPTRRRRWPIVLIMLATILVVVGGGVIMNTDLGSRISNLIAPPSATVGGVGTLSSETPGPPATEVDPGDSPTHSVVVGSSPENPTEFPIDEPTPGPTPVFTPTGGGVGQIAFASDREDLPQVFLINIDGTDLEQITFLQDGACQPAWSPDGTQLLVTSPCRDNREQYPGSSIWLIPLDGGESRQLPTIPGGGDFDPAWAPDGDRIAFTSLRGGWPQIYTMKLDGSELENLSTGYESNQHPTWDPRGTNILYTGFVNEQPEIVLMPVTGEDEVLFSVGESEGHSHPDWSIDGQLVLYERNIASIPRLVAKPFEDRLWTGNQICPDGPRASEPMAEGRWSPDNRWVVFETWPDGINHNIAIMTSSCTNHAEITTDPAHDFDPVWRPLTPAVTQN